MTGNWQRFRHTARGNYYTVGGIFLAIGNHSLRILKRSHGVDHIHISLCQHHVDAAPQTLDNAILTGKNLVEIYRECEIIDSELVAMFECGDNLSIAAETLRGDATLVKACSSKVGAVEKRDCHATGGGSQSGFITARACPYDYKICLHHFAASLSAR